MRTSIALFALLFLLGCASFTSNAGKSLASISTSVDAAMKGWATYVAINKLPEAKQVKVREAYEQYQFAMFAAEQMYLSLVKTGDRSGWAKASEALVSSQGALLLLITKSTAKVEL